MLGTPNEAACLNGDICDAVLFTEGAFDASGDFRQMAWDLEQSGIEMIVAPGLTDVSTERLAMRPVAGLPLVHVEPPRSQAALRFAKRAFDIAGAGTLLLLAGPLIVMSALVVRLYDGGPAFFSQMRVGLDGRPFRCWKIRSMVTDAEERLKQLQQQNEGAGVLFKMQHDPRITPFGRFIRRTSIDELPQLWNALKGDMSLVGPRPALPHEVARYEPHERRRLHVRPGLTGLWQVSGRSSLDWEDTVRLDLYYVDNWSMSQDLLILGRTARAVLRAEGAY